MSCINWPPCPSFGRGWVARAGVTWKRSSNWADLAGPWRVCMMKHSTNGHLAPAAPVELTVAVPTFNRCDLLWETLDSILTQQGPPFRVVVFDNASTDGTAEVIQSFNDSRLSHDRSPVNVGLLGNWNRALHSISSPLVCLCHDDDLMLDGFLAEAAAMLSSHPRAGFAYARAKIIGPRGNVRVWPVNQDSSPAGVVEWLDFLERMIDRKSVV